MKWHKAELVPTEYRRLIRQFNLQPVVAAICQRRGLDTAEKLRYFLLEGLHLLHNPFLIHDMERAAKRILRAQRSHEKVLIFGDRDVDGMTSTALLTSVLSNMGIAVQWRVPVGDEPYGITHQVVTECVEQGIDLIITIDCGIHNSAEIAAAHQHHIETIVIDHHNITDRPPLAYAIVNPKITESPYPMPEICGCMLGYKMALALDVLQSDICDKTHVIATARRSAEALHFDLLKVRNLVVEERRTEIVALNSDSAHYSQSALEAFVDNFQIYLYGSEAFSRAFQEAYTQTPPFETCDLQPHIQEIAPALGTHSLYDINRTLSIERSIHSDVSEIETLYTLYRYWHLYRRVHREQWHASYLEMTTMATVADMMPMHNENRVLVREGMRCLATTPSITFRSLMNENSSYGGRLSTHYLAFNIIPCLNAAGRRGVPDVAINMLLSNKHENLYKLSKQLVTLNHERRAICDRALNIALPLSYRSKEETGGRYIAVVHPEIPRGVTGLLASKIMERLRSSTIVMAPTETHISGSIRTLSIHNATEILQHCASHLIEWGGHDRAAGFRIDAAQIPPFKRALSHYMNTVESASAEERLEIDAEIPLQYFGDEIFQIARWFEPYGQNSGSPLFLTRSLTIQELSLFGKEDQHVKLLLQGGAHRVPAIVWNGIESVNNTLQSGASIDMVYRAEIDYFRQQEYRRLIVVDTHPV